MLVFNWLRRESILGVVDLQLADVAARLMQRLIKLDVDDAARVSLAQEGFSGLYDARSIARVVRTEVLSPLAQKLLEGMMRWAHARVYVCASADAVAIFFCSDGDTVEICMEADGTWPRILCNHITYMTITTFLSCRNPDNCIYKIWASINVEWYGGTG